MARGIGLLFGVLTHLLFGWTVYRLFPFLQVNSHGYLSDWASAHAPLPWYAWNALLAVQFAAIHSWLLHPKTRGRLERFLPSAFYGCFFCVATCLCLLLVIEFWRHESPIVWNLTGVTGWLVSAAFIASWPLLLYSLSLTGLGYQTGWTPWWSWVRGRKPPRRNFEPRGLYHLLRHPIYLAFLALIWFIPTMTIDRALLTGIWTIYIYIGSYLKDQRLIHYVGEPYRQYQSKVRGYPLMFAGPLGLVRLRKHVRISVTRDRKSETIAA